MTEKPIKILHLYYLGGGIATSIKLITENLNSNKFEHVILNGLSKEHNKKPELSNSKIYSLKFNRHINIFQDIILFFNTYKICKREKPNLIHAHSAKGGIMGKVIAFLLNKPCLHTPQAYSFLSTETKFKKITVGFTALLYDATS